MKTLIEIALCIGAGTLFIWVFSIGWSKNEIVECQKWLDESSQFSAVWYSTDWQREQCKAHGYELPEGQK